MVRQSSIDLGQHTFGQSMLAEHHHWLEVMGNTFEILLLFGRQIHGYFFIGQG